MQIDDVFFAKQRRFLQKKFGGGSRVANLAMKKTGFSPDETVIIGDRIYTDIACGIRAGISTVFVLSGEGTMDDVENGDVKPEFIYENIRKVYEDLIK